jgi:hypothetical protein
MCGRIRSRPLSLRKGRVLDTVVLTLMASDFSITNPAAFGPARTFSDGGGQRIQNATREEKRRNVTKPSLTWTKRPFGLSSETLRIEVSIPKMFLGSNLLEVEESDLPAVVEKLSQVLTEMGVAASPEVLLAAMVSKVHYSKNILLPAGMTVSSALGTLRRGLTSARRDVRQTEWENEGEGFRRHARHREVLFYDKLSEMAKARSRLRRSLNPLSCGLPLDEGLNLPAGSVLRIEVRLNTRRAVKSALRQVGRPFQDPRLTEVFSEEASKAVILYELRQFGDGSLAALPDATPGRMLRELLSGGMKPNFAFKAMGLAWLEDSITPLGLRRLLREHGVPDAFWYELKRLRRLPPSTARGENVVEMLRRGVEEFRPFRSASSPPGGAPPIEEYYSGTSSAFSGNPDSNPVTESPGRGWG